MKIKKVYGLYLMIALFIAFIIWLFNRPMSADICSAQTNICLLNTKTSGFWARLGSVFSCVLSNLTCLAKSLF